MTDSNYKKYSLENLENWLHDALSSDATAGEIVDVIYKVASENYEYHKTGLNKARALMDKIKLYSPYAYDDIFSRQTMELGYPSSYDTISFTSVNSQSDVLVF